MLCVARVAHVASAACLALVTWFAENPAKLSRLQLSERKVMVLLPFWQQWTGNIGLEIMAWAPSAAYVVYNSC